MPKVDTPTIANQKDLSILPDPSTVFSPVALRLRKSPSWRTASRVISHRPHLRQVTPLLISIVSSAFCRGTSQPPFVSAGRRLSTVYTDVWGVANYVFCADTEADLDLENVSLKERQELVWVTEDDVKHTAFAFRFDVILTAFFQALRDGTV